MTRRTAAAALAGLLLIAALAAGCSSPGPTAPNVPAGSPTPGAVRTPPAVTKDQAFGFDDIAEFPDGVEFEMAGSTATKAESTQRGADSTNGEMVTVSIRIGNFTEVAYDASKVEVTASYGNGTPAPIVLDTVGELQSGFTGSVAPSDETVSPFGFAIPFSELGKVTFVVDPGDGQHEAISFTGKVERQ